MPIKTAHLFAGFGGGLLADLILGHEPIEAVDIDPVCCSQLEDKKNAGWFPNLIIHNEDIRTFDGSRWKGRVDLIHAGVPCPKWSAAKRGVGGTFDGWDHTARIISEACPDYVFLECVRNFKRETARVKKDLKAIGYGLATPIILDSTAVGATDLRERFWAIGYADHKSEPVLRINAEVAELPPPKHGYWWKSDPRVLRMDDGMARRMDRFRGAGNGQNALQAAAAYLILGGPV